MSQTPLSRMLADRDARADALTAFKVARKAFIASERLEMQELASQLGVSRATVFRWVGSRDELLAEVVWSVAEPTFQTAVDSIPTTKRGGERVVMAIGNFADLTVGSAFFMSFIQREPERAMRLLTTRASQFQRRLVARFEGLLTEEIEAGNLTLPMPAHDFAYMMVRIAEAFIYADPIAGETPEPERVRQAISALVRA